ncbi:MAG: DegT/DnrJ/EryC1/StrS family aminotransferase [Acutalibacteraceae bacterium]|nr:DegT/DnrJ/EryC1/StrS family aminotransferase [Acutalibacteraceae bacterium]
MNKKINVTRASLPPIEEYIEEIRGLWDTRWITNMGEKHQQFKQGLKDYLSVDNISLVTNGHMAIELSLEALDLKGEVITTPFTFASTTHAIVRNGLTPVFCDISKKDYNIDVNKIEELITPKTSAILPVHVYGNVCDVEAIEEIAKKHNLKVIYDAAHTFGVEYKGQGIANFGDISCFSFHATKVFHTIEGGAVCYKDEKLAKKFHQLKNFGIKNAECIDGVGVNAKMNEFCAAMGLCNLRHLESDIEKRKKVTQRYKERLLGVDGIVICDEQKDVKSNYAYFPVLFEEEIFGANRNEIHTLLQQNNIFARKYFYPLTSDFDCYKGVFDSSKTPIALEVSKKVLTLPLYPDLELSDVDLICDLVLSLKK